MQKRPIILILGPPAVGKMTVGQLLRDQLGYAFFHNHHSIEVALEVGAWGTSDFKTVNRGIRQLIFSTVMNSTEVRGFVMTLVIAFNHEKDVNNMIELFNRFRTAGWRPLVVELQAPLSIRQGRNTTENRLLHKASKRNLELSNANLLEMEAEWVMENGNNVLGADDYFVLDNSQLSPAESAQRIVERFALIQ